MDERIKRTSGYNLGTPAFERYGQNGKRIKRYAKNVRIIYHITVCKIRVKEWEFPIIKKQQLDVNDIELISCSDVSKKDDKNLHKGVHFFVDDFRFETIYDHPEKALERYGKYRFLLTPDYSLYAEMDPWRQIESVGKARWVGAKWQANGKIVIPTVSWGLARSFEFCFDGIQKNSIVVVGMIGCKRNKADFLKGYYQMLTKIEPEAIICLGDPFDEMDGNIIPVDYLKSRKVVR